MDFGIKIRCSLYGFWYQNPMLVITVDTLSLLTFAGLSECHFSIPTPESHRSVAVLALIKGRSSHSHIPSSRLFSFNRPSGNKKAGTQMRTDFPQKDRLIPAVWLHIHVTGFEIQSRNCPLRFAFLPTVQDSLEAAAFSLAYRRRCPAYCRSLNQFVKIDIQLW